VSVVRVAVGSLATCQLLVYFSIAGSDIVWMSSSPPLHVNTIATLTEEEEKRRKQSQEQEDAQTKLQYRRDEEERKRIANGLLSRQIQFGRSGEDCEAQLNKKKKVIFVCTANACRSQMAEGWCRSLCNEWIDVKSAGVNPSCVDPVAVEVMGEAGIDISHHRSKLLSDILRSEEFDVVVTVCPNADKQCPTFPSTTKLLHVPFPDPQSLVAEGSCEEDKLAVYRRVRDEIRGVIADLPTLLTLTQ